MQHDEVIWQVINQNFCSYKVKNEYNVTGLCSRQSCPLANSQYATVREINGVIYLFMKTIERAHMPSKLWEKVKLNRNYEKAIEQIEKHLEFWPNFLVHKCKQRLTKITEYLSKMRKLKLSIQPTLTAKKSKIEKREKKREFKALVASKIENAIEKELLERLKNGVYGDNVYNWSQSTFEKVLDQTGEDDDDEKELDEDDLEFVEDDEAEDSDEDQEIEYEHEVMDMENQELDW